LGSLGGSQQNSSDIARRRESLLSHGKRFYETVQVQPCHIPADHPPSSSSSSGTGHGYQLLLRKCPVKTPAKKVLVLPTLSLALAVAAEWEWLPSGKPAPHRMPLTGLACTAIDQPKEPAKVIEHLMKYVHTDGACIRWVAWGCGRCRNAWVC
jgi:chaperone required for assembly of F1-ATPase